MTDTSTPTISTEAISEDDWPKTATRIMTAPSPFRVAIEAAMASGNAQRTNGFASVEEAKKFRGSMNTAANVLERGLETRTVANEDGSWAVYWKVGAKRIRPDKVADEAPTSSPVKGK